jgi:GNAT superfamily N-acetyltransferase
MIELILPEAPSIRGLAFRLFRGPDDFPGMLEVYRAVHEAEGLEDVTSLEDFERNYATLVNCDPTRDLVIAEVDGRAVAYARVFWQDLVDGARSYELFGFVDPAWRRRGIGGAMLRHNEARLREIAAGHGNVAVKWFGSEGADTNEGNTVLLRRAGYEPARFWYDMVAPTLEPITEAAMPDGLDIRAVTRDQYDAIWDASAEAFRDHWGMSEWAEEDRVRFMADPHNADPSLARRLGRRPDRRGDHHDRAGRGERGAWARPRLRRGSLGPPPLAPARPCAGAAHLVAHRRPRGRVHVGQPRCRYRQPNGCYRPVSVSRLRARAHVHDMAEADVTRESRRQISALRAPRDQGHHQRRSARTRSRVS